MTSAAFFLITRNLKNRVFRSLARLRQPRYLAGLLFVVVYFWSFFFRRQALHVAAKMHSGPVNGLMVLIVSVLALVILIGAWLLSSNGPGLVFSEAEIQFFFAGPVTRRQLLAYKVLRSQVQSFVSAFFFSLFAFRGSHLVGLWIAFMVVDVYLTFVSFARARLKLAGIGWWWRAAAVVAFVMVIGTMASRQIAQSAGAVRSAFGDSGAVAQVITSVADSPPLSTILYLPRLIGKTVYAPHPLLPSMLVIAFGFALFFLTTQLDVSFEDASIIASQRALARRARMRQMRSGRSTAAVNRVRPPFRLAESGPPEVAMVWKNLIGTLRMSSFPIVALVMPLVFAAAAAVFGRHEGVPDLVGSIGLMTTLLFVFFGPQAVRTDLRTDILRLDVIKTYPLSAESLLIGEMAGSLIVISAFQIATLAASVTILQFGTREFFKTPEFVVCALVFIVPVTAIQLLIQNGAIILFPAWNMTADNNRFSAMGQRMLMLLGNVVTLTVALAPAAILFLPSLWLAERIFRHSPAGVLVAAIPAAAVLVVEAFLAHKFLAAQFEDIDIANDFEAVSE